MKTVILAAGKGSRLGRVTKSLPKSMLKLTEEHTILSYNIEQLSRLSMNSIILITGYQANKIEKYALTLSDKYTIPIEIVYNPFWNYCNVLGSLYVALEKIEDDFLFLHADTIVETEVLKGVLASNSNICFAVDFKKCGPEEMKFWLDDNKIIRISKDDIGKEADGEFVGVAKFRITIIDYFRRKSVELFKSDVLNSFMEEIIDIGLKEGTLTVDYFDATGYKTIEIDFEADYEKAKNLFNDMV